MIQLKNIEKSHKTQAGFTYSLAASDARHPIGDFVTIMGGAERGGEVDAGEISSASSIVSLKGNIYFARHPRCMS